MKLLILCLAAMPLLPSCALRTKYGIVTFEPRLPAEQGGKSPILFQK